MILFLVFEKHQLKLPLAVQGLQALHRVAQVKKPTESRLLFFQGFKQVDSQSICMTRTAITALDGNVIAVALRRRRLYLIAKKSDCCYTARKCLKQKKPNPISKGIAKPILLVKDELLGWHFMWGNKILRAAIQQAECSRNHLQYIN